MNIRKLALEAIEKILEKKAFSNIVVNEFLERFELSLEDKALFTKIVYGTIQNMLTIDYYLSPYIANKKQKPWVKYLLYLSIFQLVYLDIPEYAVVNEAVDIANMKDRYIGSFVNAVLRNYLRNDIKSFDGLDEIETLSIKYSHPSWLVAYLLKDYDYQIVEKILIENSNVKNDAIRINTLKTNVDEVKNLLEQANIQYETTSLVKNGLIVKDSVIKTDLFTNGLITVQDLSAQLVSEVVSPREGDIILDACAAPGGKSAHLACLMNNTGKIYSCDIHSHKIKLMETLYKRLGITNIKTELIDARRLREHVQDESFDHVLVDAPCSGLGVMSHKVDLKYHIDLNTIEEIKNLQEEIINSTWNLVKRGGYYTYSTCTLNKEENEGQIKQFLENHPEASVEYERTILPFEYHSDGFYICKIRRN